MSIGSINNGEPGSSVRNKLNNVISRSNQKSEDVLVTVGSSGQHSTINSAIEAVYRDHYPIYRNGGLNVEIRLLSGFVMSEQVHVDGLDLSWMKITSEDTQVTIARSALNTRFGEEPSTFALEEEWEATPHMNNKPAFGGNFGAFMPKIQCLFIMDESGDEWEGRTAFSVTNGSRIFISPYCGCLNAADNGIYVTQGSRAVAVRSIFDNAGFNKPASSASSRNKMTGVLCFRNSKISMRGASVKNAGFQGIYMGSASVADCVACDFSGAGDHGVRVYNNGIISLWTANITNAGNRAIDCIELARASAKEADLSGAASLQARVRHGGEILVPAGTFISDTNVSSFNALDGNNGIIWQV